MRLRLTIKRHELPPVKILFAVPEQQTSFSKLLELINDLVPLEADEWGLEDYGVFVLGYECLHYQDTLTVLNDNDEVEVRALSSSEIKARRIAGREQVAANGAHLVDGVAFGRQFLKRSGRPPVYIPPLKRRRLTNQDDGLDDPPEFEQHLHDSQTSVSEDAEQADSASTPVTRSGMKRRTRSSDKKEAAVKFAPEPLPEEDDEDEDGDDDFVESETPYETQDESYSDNDNESTAREGVSSASSSSSDTPSDSSSDSSSESSSRSSSDSPLSPSSDLRHGTAIDQRSSKVQRAATSQLTSKPEFATAAGKQISNTPPGEGSRRTKSRNTRRRNLKKVTRARNQSTSEIKLNSESWGEVSTDQDAESELEARRRMLLDSLARTTDEPNENDEDGPLELSSKNREHAEEDETSTTPNVHAKVDLGSARRFIFNSLGVRTPKTNADERELREQFDRLRGERSKENEERDAAESASGIGDDPQSADWSEKIILSAVECKDDGVELADPPFPFRQRWDPQYQYSTRKTKSKKRKRRTYEEDDYAEPLDHPYEGSEMEGLPYDEEAGVYGQDQDEDYDQDYDQETEQDPENVQALTSMDQLVASSQTATDGEGIPYLPDDLNELLPLERQHLVRGAVIVIHKLEVSAASQWQPEVSAPKTLIVKDFDDENDMVTARLASREWPTYATDEAGRRIYEKFEMPAAEYDDEEDFDPVTEFPFSECIDPVLLVPAPKTSQNSAVDDAGGVSQPHMVQDSVNPLSHFSDQLDESNDTSKPAGSMGAVPQRESQATSHSSAGAGATLDQAAQIRASMMLNGIGQVAPVGLADTAETSMDVDVPRDGGVEAGAG